ncbi:hypothetical protein Zm00014a_015712, partial [Zea mays]
GGGAVYSCFLIVSRD